MIIFKGRVMSMPRARTMTRARATDRFILVLCCGWFGLQSMLVPG
jgi:uncharacterized membrane protein